MYVYTIHIHTYGKYLARDAINTLQVVAVV